MQIKLTNACTSKYLGANQGHSRHLNLLTLSFAATRLARPLESRRRENSAGLEKEHTNHN